MSHLKKLFFNISSTNISLLKLILKDLFKINSRIHSNIFHIQKGIDWLIHAQKCTDDDGISLGYSIFFGWGHSYPETSGYIIPTLINYFKISRNNHYLRISKRVIDWLCSIQLENGGFSGGATVKKGTPSIFNTGQILFGLINAFKEFKNSRYLVSANKAGNFLISNQGKSGVWSKYCYFNIPHTYNVRTAWALLELYILTENDKYKEVAIKNLEWASRQINKNYWFKKNTFYQKENPLLHFICYTIRGFLEAGKILDDENLKLIALNSSEKLLHYYERKNYLPARYNSNWESSNSYSCLTGDAQLSIIWLKLYEIFKEEKFLINAIKLNNYLKSKQIIDNSCKEINGAIKGSDPIWGDYMRFSFPNWATKFFCDALILEDKIRLNISK